MSTEQVMPKAPSIPPETIGDRMRRALRKEHMSVQEMADYLGVSRNTVGTWLNDHITPGEQTFKLWALRTGVPLEWLKTGRDPFIQAAATAAQRKATGHTATGRYASRPLVFSRYARRVSLYSAVSA